MSTIFTARYVMRDPGGAEIVKESDFFLSSTRAVARAIREEGGAVLSIRERRLHPWSRQVTTGYYREGFLRTLGRFAAVSTAAQALLSAIDAEDHPGRRRQFEGAREVIRQGGGFTDAVEMLGMYGPATLGILAAGERAGALREAIDAAVHQLADRAKSLRLMWTVGSVIATEFVGATMAAVMAPSYIGWLHENGIANASPAAVEAFQSALATAEMFNTAILAINSAFALLAAIGFGAGLLNPALSETLISRIASRIPVIAATVLASALADSFAVAARTLSGNVPLAECARTAAKASLAGPAIGYWRHVEDALESGVEPAEAFKRPPLSKAERLELSGAQNYQQLAESFRHIAEWRADSAKRGKSLILYGGLTAMVALIMAIGLNVLYVYWAQGIGLNGTIEWFSSIS